MCQIASASRRAISTRAIFLARCLPRRVWTYSMALKPLARPRRRHPPPRPRDRGPRVRIRQGPPPPADLSGDVAQWVIQLLDQQVNPSIAAHGGRAERVAVERGTAYLRLGGGCQGCAMATVTLSQGIETAIIRPCRRSRAWWT